jgi:hypothetical protein
MAVDGPGGGVGIGKSTRRGAGEGDEAAGLGAAVATTSSGRHAASSGSPPADVMSAGHMRQAQGSLLSAAAACRPRLAKSRALKSRRPPPRAGSTRVSPALLLMEHAPFAGGVRGHPVMFSSS